MQKSDSQNFRSQVTKKLFAKVPLQVNHFIDTEEEVKCKIADDSSTYGVALDELNRTVQPLNEKLREYSESLVKCFNESAGYIKSLAETAERIAKAHDLFNSKIDYAKSEINSDIYTSLSKCFHSWSSHISDQSKTVENYLIKSFNWTQMEIDAHNEVFSFNPLLF